MTCVFNSDKLGKQESVLLGESFTHNALVSFYVIVLYCKFMLFYSVSNLSQSSLSIIRVKAGTAKELKCPHGL